MRGGGKLICTDCANSKRLILIRTVNGETREGLIMAY
jgi:hypothetical protein